MVRNLLGSTVALLGAAAAVGSPFRSWYGGRHGEDIRVGDLFIGITANPATLWTSLFLPMFIAAVVTVIGVLFRSRLLVALAGLEVLFFAILWMVRQGLSLGNLTAGGANGLGLGAGLALGGGVLLLLGALIMRGRKPRAHGRHGRGSRHEEELETTPPYGTAEPEHYGEPHGTEPHGAGTWEADAGTDTTREMPPVRPPDAPWPPDHRPPRG